MLEKYIGPERFTLAHELAHWIYDADSPEQLAFDLGDQIENTFCYHRESLGLSDILRIREINANKLAAHLLLPEHLLQLEDIEWALEDLPGAAARWQVSRTMLKIRLQEMGLLRN